MRGARIEGGFPSGQRGQTVNLMALPSQVRILYPPIDEPIFSRGTSRQVNDEKGRMLNDECLKSGMPEVPQDFRHSSFDIRHLDGAGVAQW